MTAAEPTGPSPAAFHVGPGHVIVHGNPPFIAMFGEEVIGQPAREALVGLPAKAFDLMDLVLQRGRPGALRVTTRQGQRRFVVAPRIDPETHETYGVITHLRSTEDAIEGASRTFGAPGTDS